MSSLDLLYLAQPLILIAATTLLLLAYYRRRLLTSPVVWYSLLAYFVAISAKVAVQTAVSVPSDDLLAGLYYGVQTAALEIGLAYLLARSAVRERRIGVEQAPAYGAGLAFWENGVLLGLLALPGLALAISNGGSGLPSGSLGQVLALVALGTLERGSSVLAHFSWGILVVVAAASGRSRYLLAALPMGLIDFLVPFAPLMSLAQFEGIVFALSLLCLVVTYLLTREEWPGFWRSDTRGPSPLPYTILSSPPPAPSEASAPAPSRSAEYRARCGKCRAVFAAEWNPLLPHLGPLVLRRCPACGRRSFMESGVDAPRTWPPVEQSLR